MTPIVFKGDLFALDFQKVKKKRSENYTNQFYGSIYTQQKSGGAISISYTSKMPQTFLP